MRRYILEDIKIDISTLVVAIVVDVIVLSDDEKTALVLS